MPKKIQITHDLLDRLPGSGALHEEVLAELIKFARARIDSVDPSCEIVEYDLRASEARSITVAFDADGVSVTALFGDGKIVESHAATLSAAIGVMQANDRRLPLGGTFSNAPDKEPVSLDELRGKLVALKKDQKLRAEKELAYLNELSANALTDNPLVRVALAEKKGGFATDGAFETALRTAIDRTPVPYGEELRPSWSQDAGTAELKWEPVTPPRPLPLIVPIDAGVVVPVIDIPRVTTVLVDDESDTPELDTPVVPTVVSES